MKGINIIHVVAHGDGGDGVTSMPTTMSLAPLSPGQIGEGKRLPWGSDRPFAAFEGRVTYADTIAALHGWVPAAAMRRQITGETPMRLYVGA